MMLTRTSRRRLRVAIGSGTMLALGVAVLSPLAPGTAWAKASDTGSSCDAVLQPSTNGHIYDSSGADLTANPEYAVPLARGATFVRAGDLRCVAADGIGSGFEPGSTSSVRALPGTGATKNSANWAGYSHTATRPSSVSASFYVKSIGGSKGDQALSWVGLGGDPTTPLLQNGLHYYISSTGVAMVSLWWEVYPTFAIQDVSNNIGLKGGDQVNMTTRYANGTATFTFYDYQSNKSMSIQQSSGAPGGSAECITEREGHSPANGTYYPLVYYVSQAYTGCQYQQTGSTTPHVVTSGGTTYNSVQNGITYQTTGAPSGTNGNFTVTWKHR